MTRINRLHEQVKQILMTHWDPIGIRDVAQASNEYDQYVTPKMINERNSVSELSKHLLRLETESMGLKGDSNRARSVAEKLHSTAHG